MRNWSSDLTRMKHNSEEMEKFQLEQKINFGLVGGKLSARLLRKYWDVLRIDPDKKSYLEALLWPHQY